MTASLFTACGSAGALPAPASQTDSANESVREDPEASEDASKKETDDTLKKESDKSVTTSSGADISGDTFVTSTPEKADHSETYAAYLKILQENKEAIDAYTWQNESYVNDRLTYGTVYPVALADVYGDEAPELIFMRGSGASNEGSYFAANLVVCTYEDSMVKTLYDETLDLQVAGGTNFCVFSGKDKCLYRYDGIGDEGWEFNYSCLTGLNGVMSVTDKLRQETYPDDSYESWIDTYYHNDSEISKDEYEEIKRSYYDNLDRILLSGDNDDEVLIRIAQKKGMEALTYDESVSELTALVGSALQNDASASSSEPSDAGNTGSKTDANAAYADIFRNMSDRSMYFASGAGGWGTELEIAEDGTFTGEYHDSDMGDTGDGYPNGSCYISDFTGKFVITDKIDDWTYRMKLEDISMKEPTWTERIEDGIRYIAAVPYGITGGEEFLLYLPGKPTSDLTEDGRRWYKMPRAINDDEMPDTLPCYGIYNVATGDGFFSG